MYCMRLDELCSADDENISAPDVEDDAQVVLRLGGFVRILIVGEAGDLMSSYSLRCHGPDGTLELIRGGHGVVS